VDGEDGLFLQNLFYSLDGFGVSILVALYRQLTIGTFNGSTRCAAVVAILMGVRRF